MELDVRNFILEGEWSAGKKRKVTEVLPFFCENVFIRSASYKDLFVSSEKAVKQEPGRPGRLRGIF